jgi:hypothetical protein
MMCTNKRTLAIAAIALLVISAVTSMTATGNVFAKKYNQANSDVNNCGNGLVPTNVGCQNIGSQIQGDENSVALIAQQTFPSVTPPPTEPPTEPPVETCEECITRFLSAAEIEAFEEQLSLQTVVTTVEEMCTILEQEGPGSAEEIVTIGLVLGAAGIAEPTIEEILTCLREFFGVVA